MGFGKFDGPVPLPYALWNGLFVLFRTVLYIDVHRGLGHGLGQNAFSKIWLNFLARKVQEKAPKSSDFGVFYGGQYRTRTCDPMHVKSHPFVFFCILIIICTYFR